MALSKGAPRISSLINLGLNSGRRDNGSLLKTPRKPRRKRLEVWQPLTVTSLHGDQPSEMAWYHMTPVDFDVLSISCACLNQAQVSDSSWCHFDLENSWPMEVWNRPRKTCVDNSIGRSWWYHVSSFTMSHASYFEPDKPVWWSSYVARTFHSRPMVRQHLHHLKVFVHFTF
jgi:hypothetical protein